MPTAQGRKAFLRILFYLFVSGVLFILLHNTSYAETTVFRSANTVTTDVIIGNTYNVYTDMSNCSATDGLTCNRALGSGYGNLYFRNFGDFGIPDGSTITNIKIRVIGKANIGLYVGVSPGTSYTSNCQVLSDLWTMWILNGINISTYTVTTPISNGVLSSCLSLNNVKTNNFIWRINYSGSQSWYANIDNFEIAFDYTPPIAPTPTPTPASVQPFLDLPWDYEGKGKSFENVVLNPVSWFDHQYPLQNVPCCEEKVLVFKGNEINGFYRSHNGYDYGLKNGVVLGTPVLAAASGWATFKPESESGGAGNVIKIDHENGYQSWYEHLSPNGLIVSSTQERIFVNKGDKIGEVGMTGNTSGPHIHFSVFKDSNESDTFDDDIPWGVTDPLGWQGENSDPWTQWESNGRKGTPSYNLFIARVPPKQEEIPTAGGSISLGDILVSISSNTFNAEVKIIADFGPFESNGLIKSVMPSIFLNAFDSLGQKVTQFLQPVTITYDYADADLLNINEESLKIYWFNEETGQWEGLPSIVDTLNKKVSTETTHFSQFALMGELKDLIAPVTDVIISGDKGQEGWYRSDVSTELQGYDNDGGIGLQYTLYTINGSDWFEYKDPIIFSSEGTHTITYESYDKAENKEDRKIITFSIDKTPPIVSVFPDPQVLWPPNGKFVPVKISGFIQELHLANKTFNIIDEYGMTMPEVNEFGDTIFLEARRNSSDFDGRKYIINIDTIDFAGNKSSAQTEVIVPHDKSKE
nr:peptidoglycan DD-metalloendopeptidase family protein [Candidatus Levybacteria bacterium]